MSITVEVDGTAIVDAIPPSSISGQHRAEDGDPGFGGFLVDDPDAVITTTGHKLVTIEESECAQPRIFTGYLTERDIGRSLDRGMIAGDDARAHQVTAVDVNAVFNFRVLNGAGVKRPEETMEDRLTWLLGHESLAPFIEDAGLVSYYALDMDAADYTGAYPSAVLSDCVERKSDTPLTYFAYWDTTASAVALYFGYDYAGIGESTLAISNDLADIDGSTIFAPDAEAKLVRTPEEVYSEVVVEYAHGSKRISRKRQSTADAYVARGTTIQRPYTGRATTAQSQAETWLTKHATEKDTINVSILVPPESAGLALAGQRIDVKFTHLTNYTDWTSMRIVTSTVSPVDDTATLYRIDLVLVAPTPGEAPDELQSMYALVQGGGVTVVHWANTYDEGPDWATSIEAFAQQSITLVGGNWYRTYFQVDVECFPWGGGCYPTPHRFTVGTYYPAQFTTEPPAVRIAGLDIDPADGDATGFVGPGNGSLDPAQGFAWYTSNPPTLGQEVAGYLGVGLNISNSTGRINVWIEDLGPGDNTGPYSPPPPPLTPWVAASPDDQDDLGGTPGSTFESTSNPTVNDDADDGYQVGQQWVNTSTGAVFVLTDSTIGAAVWSPAGIGALDDIPDVNAPSPVDGDGLVWIDAANEWQPVHALTEGDVVALITPDVYFCDSLSVIDSDGVIAAGTHSDLHAVGGTTVEIEEVTGSPGIHLQAAFSGVDDLTNVFVHGYYTAAHTVTVDLYNYDTTNWDTVITLGTSQSSMQLYSAQLADGSPYFDGSGNALLRFYHAASGNITHRLYLDYIALSHTTGSTGGLALDDITDVNAPTPGDGDVLTWDDGTSTWIAAAPGGGGISGATFPIVAVFDNYPSAITGTPSVDVRMPAAGTITGWTLLGDVTGNATIDIWKCSYADYAPGTHPVDGDSITSSAPPTLTAQAKNSSSDPDGDGWDTALAAGDILRFHLDTSSTVTRLELILTYTRS